MKPSDVPRLAVLLAGVASSCTPATTRPAASDPAHPPAAARYVGTRPDGLDAPGAPCLLVWGPRPEVPPVRGSMPASAISATLRRGYQEIWRCYDNATQINADREGEVNMEILVDDDGSVIWSRIPTSTFDARHLESCLGETVCSWRFSSRAAGAQPGPALVTVPMRFTARGWESPWIRD